MVINFLFILYTLHEIIIVISVVSVVVVSRRVLSCSSQLGSALSFALLCCFLGDSLFLVGDGSQGRGDLLDFRVVQRHGNVTQ